MQLPLFRSVLHPTNISVTVITVSLLSLSLKLLSLLLSRLILFSKRSVTAVSYTHLDVYKRQAMASLAAFLNQLNTVYTSIVLVTHPSITPQSLDTKHYILMFNLLMKKIH